MMAYDDIANNKQNPFPGKLFNKPDPSGPGVDVYEGCNIDYKGADVTPQNFMDVLTGSASGKKLESTSQDNVFVFFADHGAPGLIGFPNDVMHKEDFQTTLQTMSDKKMFNKLTFYLETCNSGSMFEGMSIPGVYAVSAAGPDESSYAAYCNNAWSNQCVEENYSCVNGKNLDTCLGDLFSVNWMEEADASDMTKESLQDNFGIAKTKTDQSEVMQWGDTSFTSDEVSEFMGNLDTLGASESAEPSNSAVSVRMIDLERLYRMYVTATTSADRLSIGQELQQELNSQLAVDMIHTKFLSLVYPGDEAKQEAMRTDKVKPSLRDCEVRVHNAFVKYGAQQFVANSGFALQFHQIVVNVCADQAQSNRPIHELGVLSRMHALGPLLCEAAKHAQLFCPV